MPASDFKDVNQTARIGTRSYGTGQRLAVGATSVATASGIDAKEVLLHASTRCFIKTGAAPTAVATGDSIPLEAGEKFHMRIVRGEKLAVIRDTADGFLHVIPVL